MGGLLVGASLDRALGVGVDAFPELGEQRVLLVDRQRDQSVQELRHGGAGRPSDSLSW